MAKLSEKPDIVICEWTASLYEEKKRKWLYGSLCLKASEVVFVDGSTDASIKKDCIISFSDIISVHKATTGLVFGAVFLLMKNNQKVWFSSLSDREGVYRALKHFLGQGQVKDISGQPKISSKGRTETGTKLLGIVTDSKRTLNKAAVQLEAQGHQIDNAISTMADLHSDLDIVENLVDDLQSWVGRWRMPDQYETIDPIFINKSEIPEVFEYEVLYSKLEAGSVNTKSLGDLRISKGGLTILTIKKATEHHYNWADVSQLRVITPWEMVVIQNKIGKPDLKYSLISANMVAILKLLDKCAKYKLKYDTPPDRVVCIKSNNPILSKQEPSRSEDHVVHTFGAQGVTVTTENTEIQSTPFYCNRDLQISQSKNVVSDKEADEISKALTGLKSLALSVQKEEARQNERLDLLTNSVETANQRLVVNEKKVKYMIK